MKDFGLRQLRDDRANVSFKVDEEGVSWEKENGRWKLPIAAKMGISR